jgi:hypothetical protein
VLQTAPASPLETKARITVVMLFCHAASRIGGAGMGIQIVSSR